MVTGSETKSHVALQHLPVKIQAIAKGIADEKFLNELKALEEKIHSGDFYAVVVGLFKRGKSSLINALIGGEVAPVDVTPVTAVITLIEYAEVPSAEIIFEHTENKIISIAEAASYVSEEENPENIKGARLVRITYPSPLLKHLTLIDTPGMGSAFEHNTQVTREFIPKIDAALYVLSADTPVSKTDLDFLSDLQQTTPKIIYVVNKMDLLNENELGKMIQFNRRTLARAMRTDEADVEIYCVSSLKNFRAGQPYAGMSAIRNRMDELAKNEKAVLLMQSSRNRLAALINQLEVILKLKAESLQMPVNLLEKKQLMLSESTGRLNEQKSEFDAIVGGRIKQLQDRIHDEVNRVAAVLHSEVKRKLFSEREASSKEIEKGGAESFQQKLNQQIVDRFNELKQSLERETRDQFYRLLEQYSQRSQSFLNELATHLASLLGIDFSLIANTFDLNVYTAFYFTNVSQGASLPKKNWMDFFFSPRKRNERFIRSIYTQAQEVITANAASIIYDLQYKIQESFRKFSFDLNEHLKSLLADMSRILIQTREEKIRTASAIDEQMHIVQNKLFELEEVKNEMKNSEIE